MMAGQNQELVREAFGQMETYDETIKKEVESLTSIRYEDFMQELLECASPHAGQKVLDVATGTAEVAIRLARRAGGSLQVTGIDITRGMLERGAAKVAALGLEEAITLREGSGMELPFPDETFDLATCSMAMHHMEVKKALSEMLRVLKKGGRLVIADMGASPGWRRPTGRIMVRVLLFLYQLFSLFNTKSRAEAAAFSQCFTAEEWEEILAEASPSSCRVKEHVHPKRSWYPRLIFITAFK